METQEEIKKQMTEFELRRIYEMSDDGSLYQNLVSSLFPSIHGGCGDVCRVGGT